MTISDFPVPRPDETRDAVTFRFRGQTVAIRDFLPRTTLLDWLRVERRATGTKEGCAEGDCGACTVALRRVRAGRPVLEPVNACILLLGQVDGTEVLTVEDLAADGTLHPVQRAMVDHHGSQCGFCTPGIVMSLFVHHEAGQPVERAAIERTLAGNLCRCTGYRPIVDAALALATAPRRLADRPFEPVDDGRSLFTGDHERFFASPVAEDELADLYARHPDATLVAGATDVGLWVTKALVDLPKVIWLGRVRDLDRVSVEAKSLRLGATATHASAFQALADLDPDLGEVMRRFGSEQVRSSGTVGGNIANGSPIGDLAPCLIALGATLELRQGSGLRRLPLEDFFLAYRRQDRREGEFVRAIEVLTLPPGTAFRAFKVSKRFDEDISAVLGAFRFDLDGRLIRFARIAFGGMAGTPKRAGLTEAALVGADLTRPESWEVAVEALARDYQPLTDQRASASYRMQIAGNLLRKALIEVAGVSSSVTRIIPRQEVAHAAE